MSSAVIKRRSSPLEGTRQALRDRLAAGTYERYLLPMGGKREGFDAYRGVGGYDGLTRALRNSRQNAISEIEAAGLRGKGGASFPTGRKWTMVSASPVAERVVVANGGEHEPGSRKDTVLLEIAPHRVIEGILLAAFAVGAGRAKLVIAEDREQAIASVEKAISEVRRAGLLGEDILGSGVSVDLDVVRIPATYPAGEETAVVRFLEEKVAKPKDKPPYPAEAGIHGKPTLINNVETLATAAAIWSRGASWYTHLGVPGSPGNGLFTLGAAVNRPGVYEIPFGITFRDLIEVCGTGTVDGRKVIAFLPGGPSLPYLSGEYLDLPVDHESVRNAGSGIGCGSIHLVLEGDSLLTDAMDVAQFFASERCGQCPACGLATNAYVSALQTFAKGGSADTAAAQIRKVADFLQGKVKCALPRMAAAPALSAIKIASVVRTNDGSGNGTSQ